MRAAEKAGIHLNVVPAMLRPEAATIPYLRDLAKAQAKPCEPCVKKGIICQATNLNRVGCYACMWGRDCTWQICMTSIAITKDVTNTHYRHEAEGAWVEAALRRIQRRACARAGGDTRRRSMGWTG